MAGVGGRIDLDGNVIKPMTICMIGAGGFIGSHLCEKLMNETQHTVLAVDVYSDKIKHLLESPQGSLPWTGRIHFHRINIKNDSRLEGLIKMADLVVNLAAICTPADMNKHVLSPNLEVDSWLRFPFYDLDFGTGCPYIFMPSYFPTEGMMFLLPSFIGDGSIDAFIPLFHDNLPTFKKICYSMDLTES